MLKHTVPCKTQNLLSYCTHFWFCFSTVFVVVVAAAAAAAAAAGDRAVKDANL
jgi:hypothetical protein